jgi:hypothetical protein
MSIDKNTLTFAKLLVDSNGRNHCGITSDVYHDQLMRLARIEKRENESVQQAYRRLAESSETGALLFKAALWAPKPEQSAQDLVSPTPPPPKGPAAEALDKLVDEFSAKYNRTTTGRKISRQQAYSRVIDLPENRRLRDAVRREEMEQTLRVAQLRAPIWRAEEEFEADFRLGESKGSARI